MELLMDHTLQGIIDKYSPPLDPVIYHRVLCEFVGVFEIVRNSRKQQVDDSITSEIRPAINRNRSDFPELFFCVSLLFAFLNSLFIN